jgi:hypothetical protein
VDLHHQQGWMGVTNDERNDGKSDGRNDENQELLQTQESLGE